MPTIQISTVALPTPRRRAIAVRLTRWLAERGVKPAHVVVRFTDVPDGTVFTGGFPVEALPHEPDDLRHASVVCCVGPDRDELFQADLADEVAAALGAGSGTPFLYVEFRPTPPRQVFVLRGEGLRRADETVPTTSGKDDR